MTYSDLGLCFRDRDAIIAYKYYVVLCSDEDERKHIAETLRKENCELLYLGIRDFIHDHEGPIGEFLVQAIKPYPGVTRFKINTLGEYDFNTTYRSSSGKLDQYEEDFKVFKGKLLIQLKNITN